MPYGSLRSALVSVSCASLNKISSGITKHHAAYRDKLWSCEVAQHLVRSVLVLVSFAQLTEARTGLGKDHVALLG